MKLLLPRRKLLLGAAAGICAPAIIKAAQLPATFAGMGAPGSTVTPVSWTPTANPAGQNNGTGNATFSSVAIGSPGANDVIVVVANTINDFIAGITCNGVSMPRRIREGTGVSGLDLYSIDATSAGVVGAATTTFVLTGASTATSNQTIQVGKISNTLTPVPPNTNGAFQTTMPVSVPTNGMAVIGFYGQPPGTWTGGTPTPQDLLTNDFTAAGTLFTLHTGSNLTVSQTGYASNFHSLYAAWSP